MRVKIRERLERVIDVKNIEEARRMWDDGEVVLDAGDFKGVEFIERDKEIRIEQTEQLIAQVKENIAQLLWIGIHNTDENIREVYGGENALLNLIKGYFCLLEDLQAFKKREEVENGEV